MTTGDLRTEIAKNFDALQRALSTYLPDHAGEFALMKDGKVVAFFESPGEADGAGWSRFSDGLYSIQQITHEPVELGMYVNALG